MILNLAQAPHPVSFFRVQYHFSSLWVSQTFPFLQILGSPNYAVLYTFYILMITLVPDIVIRDEPGIEISKDWYLLRCIYVT